MEEKLILKCIAATILGSRNSVINGECQRLSQN